jgi:hypothetical protein
MTEPTPPAHDTPDAMLALWPGHIRRHPDDGWAQAYGRDVPPLLDEVAAARGALIAALGGEHALPLGGLAAAVRKLAEQRDDAVPHIHTSDKLCPTCRLPDPAVVRRSWDTGEPVGSAGD